MMVLVTYDVETNSSPPNSRLRKVAKMLENMGQRVQNSVFECLVDPEQWTKLKSDLEKTIDKSKDSLRYYYLGSNWKQRVEHVGVKQAYDPQGTLIL